MAFVFRSNIGPYTSPITPGPSHYSPQRNIRQQKLYSAPFNQSSPRKIWKQSRVPGPGTYNTLKSPQNSKMILQSCGNIFTLQRPTSSANFKSHSKRFTKKQQILPGPGQYNSDQAKYKNNKPISRQQSNLQKYLFLNHDQRANSQKGDLQIRLNDQIRDSNENKKQNIKTLQKKTVPFNSLVEKNIKIRPQTSLGPCSYTIPDPYKIKEPSNRKQTSYSLAKFKKMAPAMQQGISSNIINQQLYNCKQQPQVNQLTFVRKGFNARSQQFFGSTVSRFIKTQSEITPGPGAYDLKGQTTKPNAKQHNKHAFGSSSSPLGKKMEIFMSPFKCYTKEQIKPTPQNQKHGQKKWNFGSNQPRFRQKQNRQNLKWQQPVMINIRSDTNDRRCNTNNKSFKKTYHKAIRNINNQSKAHAKNDQRPLCYAPQINTIKSKTGNKMQVNAPFNSQSVRFAETDGQMHLIEELLAQNKPNASKQIIKKVQNYSKSKGMMLSKNPRFNYKTTSENISPCSYDPSKPYKKQFNKLFL